MTQLIVVAIWVSIGLYLGRTVAHVRRNSVGRTETGARLYLTGVSAALVPLVIVPVVGSGVLDGRYAAVVMVGVGLQVVLAIVVIAWLHMLEILDRQYDRR